MTQPNRPIRTPETTPFPASADDTSQERTDDTSKERTDDTSQERTDDTSQERTDDTSQERTDDASQEERTDDTSPEQDDIIQKDIQDDSVPEDTFTGEKTSTVPHTKEKESTLEGTLITKQLQQIRTLEEQIESVKNQLRRALADAENTRQREYKERLKTQKYAIDKFALEMLTVADNMQRATGAISTIEESTPLMKTLLEGIRLTEKSLFTIFDRFAIKKLEIIPFETIFDPNVHQVMYEQGGTGKSAGTIIQVLQEGYTLHERLLRAALVAVAKEEILVQAPIDEVPDTTITDNQSDTQQQVFSTQEEEEDFSRDDWLSGEDNEEDDDVLSDTKDSSTEQDTKDSSTEQDTKDSSTEQDTKKKGDSFEL